MQHILMFLKFGNEENLKDLLQNGIIYMNSIQYFRSFKDSELRGDSYEGVIEIINSSSGEFEIPSIGYKGKHQGIHIKKLQDEILGNIYNLYCISSYGWKKPQDFFIDAKVKEFGSHCVIIKDNPTFLKLVTEKLDELKIKHHYNFVDYYDKKIISKKVTLFEKPLEFEYQKEFRFYVERESTEPFKFSIGNIENIAELVKLEDVVNTIKLVPKNTNYRLTAKSSLLLKSQQ